MLQSMTHARVAQKNAKSFLKGALLFTVGASTLAFATAASAQDSGEEGDVVIASGIRQSLQSALIEKRNSDNLTEIIQAEDIGKLPDQNLAEVLENITGIQITRTAGVGSSVQIRGTDANRTEINGVSTVGSGGGRSGISFEDLPASLISSVEVTKVPEAKTIEGSVGGTINLRTIRPLDLQDPVIAFRAQVENSDLADTTTPRFSGTLGNKWENARGQEFGVVFGGSYIRQDVAAFRPRVDRDGLVFPGASPSSEDFPFLRIQFFDQDLDNFEFETLNLNGSLEYSPNDNLKFYLDGIYNDQERAQESTRVQLSGVSAGAVVDNTTNTAFETVDFGTVTGPNGPVDLGSVQAVLAGVLLPGVQGGGNNRINPNLRVSGDTGARVTDSNVWRAGADWEKGRVTATAEFSVATSNTVNPNFTTTLDFINPNGVQPAVGVSLDNGVPLEFDLNDDTLQFGLATGFDTTPSTAQLLDPANYQLRQVQQSFDVSENREAAIRFDVSYDTSDIVPFITSFDAGYRYNDSSSLNDDSTQNFNFTNDGNVNADGVTTSTGDFNRPNGNLFADLLIAGPNNFNAADDRRLFIEDFLVVDPEASFNNPNAVRDALNAAIAASNALRPDRDPVRFITVPTQDVTAFFDITEETHALYAQANFNTDNFGVPVRGNLGLRWVDTEIASTGNTVVNGVSQPAVTTASYDFFLPRFNLVVEPTEDLLIRGGIARDIRRPNFDDLSTSVNFGTGANQPVEIGNPALVPESVYSFDLSAEYYFSPASILSVGVFHKTRNNLFTNLEDNPPGNEDPDGTLNIDITAPCEDGGIFNPVADRNINNPAAGDGICVPLRTISNGEGNTTQTGVEVAFQYDLSGWEDKLGWASGFGFIGNYTYQVQGGSAVDFPSNFRAVGGNRNIFENLGIVNPAIQSELDNLSRNSYNVTAFYEKYGLSARARYTWRSSFQSTDNFAFGVPRINASRGQLNASVNYDINDYVSVGLEGINLTREDQNQFCVTNNSLLCFQGLTDRRLVAGINFRY